MLVYFYIFCNMKWSNNTDITLTCSKKVTKKVECMRGYLTPLCFALLFGAVIKDMHLFE